MESDRLKAVCDGLLAEAASLASSGQKETVAHCCACFVRLLESIAGPLRAVCFKVGDDRGILHAAANLQPGFFRDLEILFSLFDLTQQVVSSLEDFLSLEKGRLLTGVEERGFDSTTVHILNKRSFVSAFSLLEDEANDTAIPKPQFSRSSVRSSCLAGWKFSKSPALEPYKSPTEGAELEAATKMAEVALKIGGASLKHLRVAIMDMKDRLRKAGDSLEAIFFSTKAQFPSYLVRAQLRKVVQSFLVFESFSDPVEECQENLCPVGCEIARPVVEKVVSEVLDPGGPFVVGICGPEGIGKTSVASSLASDPKIKRRFVGGVFWVSADRKSNPLSLQYCLWKAISGSKTVFNSVEEGLVALKRKFSNCLPSLLIVDGASEAAHLEGLLCFDGKEYGRIIVTTSNPQIFPFTNTHTHTLSFVTKEDAFNLFRWGAGWNGTVTLEEKEVATKLLMKCGGSPLFIQALASILYIGSAERKQVLQMLLSEGGELEEEQRITMMQSIKSQDSGDKDTALNDNSAKVKIDFERETGCSHSMLFQCFNALGLIHPLLQECFLDLAAFPEGNWVSLSILEELWLAFGNGLTHEEIVVVLSILVCRSMVDWKLNMPDTCNLDLKIEFKLSGAFHNLASRIIHQDIQEHAKKKHCSDHFIPSEISNNGTDRRDGNVPFKYLACMKRIFGYDNSYVSCTQEDIDLYSGELVTLAPQNEKSLGAHERIAVLATEGKCSSNTDRTCRASRLSHECRLFMPGCNMKSTQEAFADESLLSTATKISLCSSNVQEFPNSFSFTSLHVGFFGENARLSSLPSPVLRNMSQLQVLDLRGCVSLTHLPRAISALKSLQLLDLSFCTSLRSLPCSIGHLKRLKFLRLFGCTSLTRLPQSIGSVKDLEALQLSGCIKLKSLPSAIGRLSLLKILDLKGCFALRSLPLSVGFLRELRFVDVSECSNLSYTLPYYEQLLLLVIGIHKTGSMAVPISLWNCGQVEVLRLASLKNITFLPNSIGRLQHIRHLDLANCRRLDFLPEQIGNLQQLQELDLSHTAIRKLPDSIGKLGNLIRLCLRGCSRLLCIPSSISLLSKLRCLDMTECWDLVLLPDSIGNSNSLGELVELDLACCGFKSLPSFSWHALPKLKQLKLLGCYILSSLPPTMESLTSLEKVDLEGCCALTSLKGIGLGKMEKLGWLSLRNCTSLTSLPVKEITELKSLRYLDVSGCTGLSPFPQILLDHARQGNLTLIRWGAVWT